MAKTKKIEEKKELEKKPEEKKTKEKGVIVIDINGKEILRKNLEQAKAYIKICGGKLKK